MKAGWKQVQLGEVAELSGRIGWKGLTAKEYTKDGPLFLSVHALNYGDYVDFRDANHISIKRYDESPEIMLRHDDVLICKDGAGIGKVGIIGQLPSQATINSSLLLIRAGSRVYPKYLYHCLCGPDFQGIAKSRIEGATTPHLYQREINTFLIPLPPLEEQKQIVTVLDEAFEELAHARSNTEANLEDARELYNNALEKALVDFGAPLDDLGNHVDQLVGYAFKSAEFTDSPADVRLMRGDNIVPGGIRWEGAKYWPADRVEGFERYFLKPHDVLIAMDRTWIKTGIKFAIVAEQDTPSLLVQRVARLRAKASISVDFLAALIRSREFARYVLSIQTGTGVPHISGGQINAFPVRVPPIEVQRSIMERLNAIRNAAETIATNIQVSAVELDALRQSLLQKAFSGELT